MVNKRDMLKRRVTYLQICFDALSKLFAKGNELKEEKL